MITKNKIKVAFILSTNRAGSTWLSLILGSHSWASYLGEFSRNWDPDNLRCNLCVSKGKEDCTLFEGVRSINPLEAHSFARERTGAAVLIDASKVISWAKQSAGNKEIDARIVFLYCHPCKYVASVVRRNENSIGGAFNEWKIQNKEIIRFIKRSSLPAIAVNYEKLAQNQEKDLPVLCNFLWGYNYEKEALIYWNYEHHGLGGTGANSMYLKKFKEGLYLTFDDKWYDSLNHNPQQVDERWKAELDKEAQEKIILDKNSRELLKPGMHLKHYKPSVLYSLLLRIAKKMFSPFSKRKSP